VNFDIMYGEGIARTNELLILAEANDLIKKSGAWFSYEGTKIGQGKNNAVKWLKENADIAQKIEQELRDKFSNNTPTALVSTDEDVLEDDNFTEDDDFNDEEL
jgi:recA bacterial DNA recombination protein